MTCPKCKSENVIVTTEQNSSKTKTSHTSILRRLGRAVLIICTCGLWLLVPKKKETGKTKIKSNTVAICQNCGNKWKVS